MHIAGEIEGSVDLAGYDLTVTADSRVRADVKAREVEIAGSIQGNVVATRKITVRTGGKLIGDLRTPGIVIEDGSYFKGNIEIVTGDPRQDERQPELPGARAVSANSGGPRGEFSSFLTSSVKYASWYGSRGPNVFAPDRGKGDQVYSPVAAGIDYVEPNSYKLELRGKGGYVYARHLHDLVESVLAPSLGCEA